ncbi:MAG TPA: hypothetical protein VMG12_27195, partial [Polyangiaceae bacterium]|nr:hypothetical protein [Polyangiaceae bacterium]
MPRSGAWVVACAWVLAGASSLARAAELELNDTASCTTLDELSFRVSRALGQPLEGVGGRRFTVDIRHEVRRFHAQLTTSGSASGASAQRQLNAASCEELVDALALAIALASGAQAASDDALPASSEAAPAPEAAPSIDAPSAKPETESAAEAPAESLRAGVELSALADTGSLPGAGFGAAVSAQLAWRSLELRAQGILLPGREAVIDANAPGSPGGRLSLIAGALSVCTPLSEARFVDVSACVGAELGRLSGTGTRVPAPHERHRPWAAARLDLGARWPLPNLPLGVELMLTL